MNKKSIQIGNQSEQKLVLVQSEDKKELVCPQCSSSHYKKAGIWRTKQRYRCKDCGRQFVENPLIVRYSENEVGNFDFNNDIWTASQLGTYTQPHSKKGSIVNFTKIQQLWLKQHIKRFIIYVSSNRAFSSLNTHYLVTFNCFSQFLHQSAFEGEIEDISRSVIIEYIAYITRQKLSAKSKGDRLSALSLFFEIGTKNKWFKCQPYLINKEDYPKYPRPLPRFIPEEVTKQLNQHLHKLPEPVMRMVLVLQECGLRIGELCQLPIDCLKQDNKNQYRIQFMRWKMKKEDTLPISLELAQVIKEQQQYIKDQLGNDFQYLFCGRKALGVFIPEPKVMSADSFVLHLRRLAEEFSILDNSGKPWHFQTHQFRHTVGTRMINAGVPQHIIQRYLGHESPAMTAVYAHIHDQTLRREIEKYHESRVVNFQGQVVELEETILSSNDDLEWFKKNVQARALEHGYCARPKLLGDCDIPGFDGCYNCPFWRTNKNFLSILQDTLERTNKVLEKARNCGWELQVKKNEPIKHNLEKVIKSLEEGGHE